MRKSSRVNPVFYGTGDSYEGPFAVTAGVNGDDEPILVIKHGRFHLGTVTVETDESIFVDNEFGPFTEDDLVANPCILSIDIYSYAGLKFRFGMYNPNAFDQQPGNVYVEEDGSTPTDQLNGTVLLDDEGDPVEVNMFKRALAYVTFEEVDNGDPLVDNFWEPTTIVQWHMSGDIDIPRVGRGAV